MREYRILEEKYYDEHGKEIMYYYIVQYRKSFLGIRYWKNITHDVSGMSGSYSVTTRFPTEGAATEFAERCICGGRKWDGWVTKVITTKKCG